MLMTRVVSCDATAHLFSIGENQSGREHQQTPVSVTVMLCPTEKELREIHAPFPLARLHLPTRTDLGTTTLLACSQYQRTAGLPEDERTRGSLQEVQGHTLEHLSLSLCRWVSERSAGQGQDGGSQLRRDRVQQREMTARTIPGSLLGLTADIPHS